MPIQPKTSNSYILPKFCRSAAPAVDYHLTGGLSVKGVIAEPGGAALAECLLHPDPCPSPFPLSPPNGKKLHSQSVDSDGSTISGDDMPKIVSSDRPPKKKEKRMCDFGIRPEKALESDARAGPRNRTLRRLDVEENRLG